MSRRRGRWIAVLCVAPVACALAFVACGGKRATPGPTFFGDEVLPDTRIVEVARVDADASSDLGDLGPPIDAPDGDAGDVPASESALDGAIDADDTLVDTGPVPDAVIGACADAALSAAETGGCGAVVQSWPVEGEAHIDTTIPILYCTKPPHSGPHYPFWAAFQTYKKPVKYGYMVHALEHGAVIILYKCATTCPEIEKELQKVIDARPVDPLCDVEAGLKRRIILAPDPTLDVAVAAAAWTWTYRATCVDAPSLGTFIDTHYAKAPEDFCADGVAELP